MAGSIIRPLSTYGATINGMRSINKSKSGIDAAGRELATGLHADVTKALGMKAAISLNMRNLKLQTEQYLIANKLADNKLGSLATSIGKINERAQEFNRNAIQAQTAKDHPLASSLQMDAMVQLESVINYMNTAYNGEYMFSGVNSENRAMRGLEEVDPISGKSPLQAIRDIIGGDLTSSADAATKIAQIEAIFDNTAGNESFEGLFYMGTPLEDGSGNPNPRMKHMADDYTPIYYGVQANDQPFRDIIKGLAMLAAVDASKFSDDQAYRDYVGYASKALSVGTDAIIDVQAVLGGKQEQVARAIVDQEDKSDMLNNRVLDLEGVDPYEAQARLEALTIQMQATYQATARMQGLSFLNYMR